MDGWFPSRGGPAGGGGGGGVGVTLLEDGSQLV